MVPMKVLAAAISQVLGSPLHPTHASISGGAWTPAQWFLASEQGAWYYPSDFTRYMAGGPNLFPDPDWATLGGWEAVANATIAVSGGELIVTATGIDPIVGYRLTTVIGKQYEVQITLAADAMTGNTFLYVGSGGDDGWSATIANVNMGSTLGRYNIVFTATTTDTRISVSGNTYAVAGETFRVTRPVVRELTAINTATMFQDSAGTTPVTAVEQPVGKMLDKSGRGNHASQSTAASRPVLSARKNWLLNTSSVGGTSWGTVGTGPAVTLNAAIAPNAATEASRLVFSVTGSTNRLVQNTATLPGGSATGIVSIWLRGTVGGEQMGLWNGQSINIALPPLTTEWVRYSLPAQSTATTSVNCLLYAIAGTPTIEAWGAQVEVSAPSATTPTTYQRVNTETDYDTVGFPHYLKFDGVDDFLSTGSIDFTATDKMTVVAGVMTLSESAQIVCELSSSVTLNVGSFYFVAGIDGVYDTSLARGSAEAASTQVAGFATASTGTAVVRTATHDIAGDLSAARRNGVAGTSGTGDKGAGNFGNYPLYIGCRGGTSAPFIGHLYQLVVRGAATADLAPIESFTADKTGVTLP